MEEPVDDFTKRIMERARERREMLSKKMADNSSRKRSSPLSVNQSENIVASTQDRKVLSSAVLSYTKLISPPKYSPSKRYCSRDEEQNVHSDTPAIIGVKSRMQNLMETRKQWFTGGGKEDEENNITGSQSLPQPNFDDETTGTPSVGRKARFAALADSVNNWEDDLSHPTLKQEVKPKKVWQPSPVHTSPVDVGPAKPPRTYEHINDNSGETVMRDFNIKPKRFVSPARKPVDDALSPPKMTKTENSNKTVVSSVTVMLGSAQSSSESSSPVKTYTSTSSVVAKSPSRSHIRNVEKNSSPLKKSPGKTYESHKETVTVPSPTRKDLNHVKKEPRASDVHEPTKKPVSARLAGWQQKIESQEPQPSSGVTGFKTPTVVRQVPKSPGNLMKTAPISKLPQNMNKPISAVQQSNLNTTLVDDPLNMSIHSRMNVWESKIKDNNHEKENSDQVFITPRGNGANPRHMSGSSQGGSAVKILPVNRSNEAKPLVKSDSTLATPISKVGSKSPLKMATSPGKVGEATRSIHDKLTALHQQWSNNDIAEKIKQQKEEELNLVKNRWKNGVLQEQDERQKIDPKDMPDVMNTHTLGQGVPPPPPPPPQVMTSTQNQVKPNTVLQRSPRKQTHGSPKKQKKIDPQREDQRNVMRKENDECNSADSKTTEKKFEDKLQMMGFEMNTSHSAELDLTPYKEKEKAEKAKAKATTTPIKQTPVKNKLHIEETKTTTVTFDDHEKVTIHRNKRVTPYIEDDTSENVTSYKQFTPSKPPTGASSGAGTPSIYSLIKKNTGASVPASPYARTGPQTTNHYPVVQSKYQPSDDRDSFSEDSFESQSTMDTEENEQEMKQPPLPARGYSPVRQPSPARVIKVPNPANYRDSQVSLTSEYSETATDDYTTQDESVSETDDYAEGTETTQSDEYDDEESDEDSDNGDVSDLLDEALSNEESDVREEDVVSSPRKVQMRQNSTARSVRPMSQPPEENRRRAANTEDYYRCTGQRKSAPSHPKKNVQFRDYSGSDYTSAVSSSHSSSESDRDEARQPLAYSIDMYRQSKSMINAPVPKMTIVRQPEHPRPEKRQAPPTPYTPSKPDTRRIQDLQDRVNQEQSVIMQTSNALNQCCGQNMQFAGTQEAVECHKLLLIACKKREAYINEMHNLKHCQTYPSQGPEGSLSVSNITLPLKQEFKRKIGGPNDLTVHYFLLLLRLRDHVVFTQMVSTHNEMVRDSLDIPNLITFKDIRQDFKVDVEVYGMSVTRESNILTPSKKKKGPFTPKKLLKKGPLHLSSPGGPSAVRSTNFVLVAHMQLNARSQGRTHFMLENVPFSSPLHGSIHLRMQCCIESSVEERGFLTMFEDVSGFGAWHRRWFVLKQGFVSFWKYPDDEKYKEPLGYFDLKQCITDSIGLIPRDICARPNTFELITVRRQTRGETDTLVSRCYNTMTTTKHWLSADTKEERILWCNRLNEALENIRTWHSDALRPIKRNDMVTPYNPYPSKSDQRECIVPFNPHDQQSTC